MKKENKRWPTSPGGVGGGGGGRGDATKGEKMERVRDRQGGGAGWETRCRKWNWSLL